MAHESHNHPDPPTRPQKGRRGLTADDAFKIGGVTLGSIALFAALGNLLGPMGAASGAVIGGVAGAVLSTWDALRHRSEA